MVPFLSATKKTLVLLLGAYRYDILRHLIAHRRFPQLENPITFNDKLANRKLRQSDPRFPILTNKLLVRAFVEQKTGTKFLTRMYFSGDDPEAINIDALPESFVVKATHGSGADFLFFVRDKQNIPTATIKQRAYQLLKQKYGHITNESWYTKMHPQIIVEEMLQDDRYNVPLDYKIFVFGGQAKLIQVDYSRFTNHTRTLYDINWQALPFTFKYPQGIISPKPKLLAEMISAAESLAEGFDFLRVDLYCINDQRIVFGEITLTPEAGWGKFCPKVWDYKLGEMWPNDKIR